MNSSEESYQPLCDSPTYRLLGTTVLAYRYIVPHGAKVFVGDVVKITDREKGYTFFAKVTDLSHYTNHDEPHWDTATCGGPQPAPDQDVFIEVHATPLGFIDDEKKFRSIRTIPSRFSEVRTPDAADFAFLKEVMGDIEVGEMRTGLGVLPDVKVGVPSKVLSQHMGVFATTGMGKSNFMKVFCISCMKRRTIGMLVVDPHGEYVQGRTEQSGAQTRGLTDYLPGREGLSIYSVRPKEERERFGMKELCLEHDDFRISDLGILYELSPLLWEIVESLDTFKGSDVIDFFINEGVDSLPSVTKVTAGIGRHPEMADVLRSANPGPLRMIQRRIESLVHSNQRFLGRLGSSIRSIIEELNEQKLVLIDIPGMSERSELFILSAITRMILHERVNAVNAPHPDGIVREPPQVLIVIEEAQRVLSAAGMSTQIFRECAMEGRKFGVGLCAITQQPKNIDSRILAQMNTFIEMGLSDQNDRQIIAGSAKQDLTPMDTEVQTLSKGEAVISTIGIPFPISTKIHLFQEYLDQLNRQG